MTPRFILDLLDGRELVVYDSGPITAMAKLVTQLGGALLNGSTLRPAGFYDPATNTVVGAPDVTSMVEGRTVFGA
ncbi:MAG: hypothetical protein JWM74_1214 [Myxococcaceae bacterium]|nr:hypothetical protein [Myxococcaceae bacterium]